ncbi:1754_t:CDS:2, partial [Cetraspora pellucida]
MASTGTLGVNKNELCKEVATECNLQQLRVSTITGPREPIRNNTVAQKKHYNNLSSQIAKIKKNIIEKEKQLKKLKRHASSQQKSQIKKLRVLNDDGI